MCIFCWHGIVRTVATMLSTNYSNGLRKSWLATFVPENEISKRVAGIVDKDFLHLVLGVPVIEAVELAVVVARIAQGIRPFNLALFY